MPLLEVAPRYSSFDRLATGSGAGSGVREGAERGALAVAWGMGALSIAMEGMAFLYKSYKSPIYVPSALSCLGLSLGTGGS